MAKRKKPLFSQKSFIEWLKQQHPNRRFYPCTYRKCPIGAFNRANGREAFAGDVSGTWIRTFIDKVDHSPSRALSPKQCLAIMENLKNA